MGTNQHPTSTPWMTRVLTTQFHWVRMGVVHCPHLTTPDHPIPWEWCQAPNYTPENGEWRMDIEHPQQLWELRMGASSHHHNPMTLSLLVVVHNVGNRWHASAWHNNDAYFVDTGLFAEIFLLSNIIVPAKLHTADTTDMLLTYHLSPSTHQVLLFDHFVQHNMVNINNNQYKTENGYGTNHPIPLRMGVVHHSN